MPSNDRLYVAVLVPSTGRTVANRRLAMSRLGSKAAVQKLFNPEFRARFTERPGGYTRILKMAARLGDAADMALIELVDYALPEEAKAE